MPGHRSIMGGPAESPKGKVNLYRPGSCQRQQLPAILADFLNAHTFLRVYWWAWARHAGPAKIRQGSYTRLADCPNGGKWEAVLVEANPRFNQDLQQVAANHPGQITAMTSSAAYMCEAETSFYLDTVNTQKNYWGSSLSPSHQDVVKSGKVKVTVPTKNLLRILHEHTTAEDNCAVLQHFSPFPLLFLRRVDGCCLHSTLLEHEGLRDCEDGHRRSRV